MGFHIVLEILSFYWGLRDYGRTSVAKPILLPGNAYCTVEIQLFVGLSVVPPTLVQIVFASSIV